MNPSERAAPGESRMIGGYLLRRVLGRGGMGTVHLASTPTGGLAAVKVINPELARDPAFRRRFEREVAAARMVARFCTAPVLDAGLDPAGGRGRGRWGGGVAGGGAGLRGGGRGGRGGARAPRAPGPGGEGGE